MFKFGIVSTGFISNILAMAIRSSDTATLNAVSSRNLEKAQEFVNNHKITDVYRDWREMLEKADIDGVYLGTPTTV